MNCQLQKQLQKPKKYPKDNIYQDFLESQSDPGWQIEVPFLAEYPLLFSAVSPLDVINLKSIFRVYFLIYGIN